MLPPTMPVSLLCLLTTVPVSLLCLLTMVPVSLGSACLLGGLTYLLTLPSHQFTLASQQSVYHILSPGKVRKDCKKFGESGNFVLNVGNQKTLRSSYGSEETCNFSISLLVDVMFIHRIISKK